MNISSYIRNNLPSQALFAEGAEISLFTGYRAGGNVENASTGNEASFDESNSQGVIFDIDYDPEHVVEFLYSRQNTSLRDSSVNPNPKLMNVELEYFQLGGSRVWRGHGLIFWRNPGGHPSESFQRFIII